MQKEVLVCMNEIVLFEEEEGKTPAMLTVLGAVQKKTAPLFFGHFHDHFW